MNGIAIIVPGDFSANALGQVTFLNDVDITAMAITADALYRGTTVELAATYTPSNTSQRGCTWSITDGSSYATIDSATGVLTILSNASASNVTVKATSIYDTSIIATATFAVTYAATVDILTSISVVGDSTIVADKYQFSAGFVPTNTSYNSVTWSIVEGGEYATINSSTGLMTVLSTANLNTVKVRATSTHDSAIYGELTTNVTFSQDITGDYTFDGTAASVVVTKVKLFDGSIPEWTLFLKPYNATWNNRTLIATVGNYDNFTGTALDNEGGLTKFFFNDGMTTMEKDGISSKGIGIKRTSDGSCYYTLDGTTWVKYNGNVITTSKTLTLGGMYYSSSLIDFIMTGHLRVDFYKEAKSDISSLFA